MSKTITIKGWMYFDPNDVEGYGLGQYRFFGTEGYAFGNYVPICPHVLTFEIPDGFDPRPEQIKQLEKQREEMTAKYQAMVTEINARISKLQAITFEPTAQGETA